MLNKFINYTGLQTVIDWIKDIFLQKSEASTTYATTEYVNAKNTVKVLDTRNEAYSPSWYMQNQDRNMVFEFKDRGIIGHPPLNSSSGPGFTLMLTMVPWRDKSGGYPTQITFGNSIALRRAISDTEWGSWEELPYKSDIPTALSQLSQDGSNRLVTDAEKNTWNSKQNALGYTPLPISNGVLENYREKLVTLSGTSTAINLSLGNVFTHTLSGNTTYSITNAVNGQAHSFTLIITQTATVRTIIFPSSVKWQDGEIPDMSTPLKEYELFFATTNGGGSWRAGLGGVY